MSLLWVAAVWSLLSVLTAAVACVVFHGGEQANGSPVAGGAPQRSSDAEPQLL